MGDTRKYTEAQKNSAKKWDAANLDRMSVALPKGSKDKIKAHAETRNESVNAFIGRAISETMERDGVESPVIASISEEGILTLPTLKAAQKAAETAGETTAQFVARAVDTQAQRDKMTLKLKSRDDSPAE